MSMMDRTEQQFQEEEKQWKIAIEHLKREVKSLKADVEYWRRQSLGGPSDNRGGHG